MLKGFGKGLFPSRTKKKASEPEGPEAVIPVISLMALLYGDAETASGGTRRYQNASSEASSRYSHSISASARDCLSMLCLEHGRHRIEELPHMVCGLQRMKQPVRHETVPIGRDGFEHGVDVGPQR